jgi:uncharacterized protein (TIGR03905 family)
LSALPGGIFTQYNYETEGPVCPVSINVTLQGNIVTDVEFDGGCDGNLKALRRVVKGMTVDEVEKLFSGIVCEDRGTSCSDQLAKAVRAALEQAARAESSAKND